MDVQLEELFEEVIGNDRITIEIGIYLENPTSSNSAIYGTAFGLKLERQNILSKPFIASRLIIVILR